MTDTDRAKVNALILKARFYRIAALIFAIMGLIVFAVMYFQGLQGNFMAALQNPLFVVVVAFPFLPAAILSWMAASMEKKASKLLESRKK